MSDFMDIEFFSIPMVLRVPQRVRVPRRGMRVRVP